MSVPSLPSKPIGVRAIRKYLMILPALLVIAALLIASAPVEAGTRRVALGVWDPEGTNKISVFDEFSASMGGIKPAIWNVRSQWGSSENKAFPMEMARAARQRGATLMVTWLPFKPPLKQETGYYSRFKNIAAGKHDRYIRAWARQARKFNKPVLLRFAHEFNAKFFPWSVGWGKFYNTTTGERTLKNDPSISSPITGNVSAHFTNLLIPLQVMAPQKSTFTKCPAGSSPTSKSKRKPWDSEDVGRKLPAPTRT
jgi:hypothetical protein